MRILVVGMPKSGTTILTYRIAAALEDVVVEFEPRDGPDPSLVGRSADLVTKKLVGSQTADLADFARFDRRIWICRDPRDFLVSQSLYRWHRDQPPTEADRAWFDRVVTSIEAKEADPRSVAFLDLDPADYTATFDAVAELWRREGDDRWLLYRYEDMVAGSYRELDEYLGFEVDRGASVAPGLERVVRHKEAGDWRHWFTERDVAHYADGRLDHYMETFGYDVADWRIDPNPTIDPAHGSDYVRSLFDDHRRVAADPSPGPLDQNDSAAPSSSSPVGPSGGLLDRLRHLARAWPG